MAATVLVGTAPWTVEPGSPAQFGLFKRNGSGEGWVRVTKGLPEAAEVRYLCADGPAANNIYAATQFGPYRSADGGESWTSLDLPAAEMTWSLLVHPTDARVLYAGTIGTNVYRSEDAGRSWTQLAVPEPDGLCQMGFPTRVIRLAVDSSNPEELYVALEVGGLVRSLDGGRTWDSCNDGLLGYAQQDTYKSRIGSGTTDEGMMDSHSLAVSKVSPGTVFLANRMGLWCSTDRGESWSDMAIGRFSPLTYARDVKISPHHPQTLFGAFSKAARSKQGSLYRSADEGRSWSRFDHGVEIDSTLMIIGASAADERHIYCASREGKVFGTEDGGANWSEECLPLGVEGVYGLVCL